MRRTGGSRRAAALDAWLGVFPDRFLALDAAVARLAGAMSDEARAKGRDRGLADVMIAATARHHGLAVATRNMRHFEPLGIACLDPMHGAG